MSIEVTEKPFIKIRSLEAVIARRSLTDCLVMHVDFRGVEVDWDKKDLERSLFLGCYFDNFEYEIKLRQRGAHIFPRLSGLPFDPYQADLYTPDRLYLERNVETGESRDDVITKRYYETGGRSPNVVEGLAQRLHDSCIDEALRDYINGLDTGTPRKLVGFMGGHSVPRATPAYDDCASLARTLAQRGFIITTGGGPGIMEAANFGAYMAAFDDAAFQDAISMLDPTKQSKTHTAFDQSVEVIDKYKDGMDNLSIPTYYYADEHNNPFATKIAKYFANSLREDGLTSLCNHGVVFCEGGPGTIEEVFMSCVQNYYQLGVTSPMILFGKEFYGNADLIKSTHVFEVLQFFGKQSVEFAKLLLITDSVEETLNFILKSSL